MTLEASGKESAMKRAFSLLTAAFVVLGTFAAATPIPGTFALQAGTPKAHGFLRASSQGRNPLVQQLDIWMTPQTSSAPILRYSVDMTKLLHLIIVSDDFKQFFHVHPVLGSDGHFRIVQSFPSATLYHAYADAEPQGRGQQVFRFDFPVNGGTGVGTRALSPTGTTVAAGPYTVTLSTTTLAAGKDSEVTVHVRRAGKPANDLHPYLGALAHAVFLDAKDLTYVHVHPGPLTSASMPSMPGMDAAMPGMSGMEMPALPDSATTSPDMALHVSVHEAGAYKLWLQFRGGSSLYVAAFVLSAK